MTSGVAGCWGSKTTDAGFALNQPRVFINLKVSGLKSVFELPWVVERLEDWGVCFVGGCSVGAAIRV